MNENDKHELTFFAGLAMVGLLMRSKGSVIASEITEDAFTVAKFMATELRRISDGSNDE